MAEGEMNISLDESQNLEDSEVTTLTLKDVLDLEDELIENTAAVLGAANDKTCSYTEGYMKRQALYSCLTCLPEAKTDASKGAGICLACSFHCHDGHDLVELYTKRNFRCDCGNTKFPNLTCNLYKLKSDVNDLNEYNQNFSGVYCVCHRPYPDPEDPVPDEMVQCIVCEDWYHTRHLGTEFPSNNFTEMICEACMTKHAFLLHYDGLFDSKITKTAEEEPVDAEKVVDTEETSVEPDTTTDVPPTNGSEITESKCTKPSGKSSKVSAKFFHDINWRKNLCTCDDCLKMYEDENVSFLLDDEDPVYLYEEKGKARAKEIVENHDRNFINSLDRVQLVEAISGYNDLKDHLVEYLKKFAENKKIVRPEDIKEFFEGMNARKKQRTSTIPHFCR